MIVAKTIPIQIYYINEDADNRELSTNDINWNEHKGFYIDLINTESGYSGGNLGERQITNSSLLENKVIFTPAVQEVMMVMMAVC